MWVVVLDTLTQLQILSYRDYTKNENYNVFINRNIQKIICNVFIYLDKLFKAFGKILKKTT